jgi:hypothetical protein
MRRTCTPHSRSGRCNGLDEVVDGAAEADDRLALVDELGRGLAEDVGAEQRAVVGRHSLTSPSVMPRITASCCG